MLLKINKQCSFENLFLFIIFLNYNKILINSNLRLNGKFNRKRQNNYLFLLLTRSSSAHIASIFACLTTIQSCH